MLAFGTMSERRSLCAFELLEGLVKVLSELRGCDVGDAAEWVEEAEVRAEPVWSIFEQLQAWSGARVLVDKSPTNIDHPNYLSHAHAIFGSAARYVHLIRHPYACITSGVQLVRDLMRNDAFNPARGGAAELAWLAMERAWVRGNLAAREFLAGDARDRISAVGAATLVRYEDLLRQPASVLAALCELVDVEDRSEQMSEPYESVEVAASFTSALLLSATDPKLMRRTKIDAAQADKWRGVKLPQPLMAGTKALAVQLGYECSTCKFSEQ